MSFYISGNKIIEVGQHLQIISSVFHESADGGLSQLDKTSKNDNKGLYEIEALTRLD